MHTYGHWKSPWQFNPEEWYGFVYRIHDLEHNRYYIGKKQLLSRQRKKVSGRKNRKVVYKPTNWESYTGSSNSLNETIQSIGKDRFEFFIESLHETKGSLYYGEVLLQIKEDVLRAKMDNGEYKYYNGQISSVRFRPPEFTERELQYNTWFKD